MTTGARFANLELKKLLSNEDLRERFLDYLRTYVQEHMARAWGDDGVFGTAKMDVTGTGTDEVEITPGTLGLATDGQGRLLSIGMGADDEESGQIKLFPVPNEIGVEYDIGLKYVSIPSGIVINPRTGMPQYKEYIEGVGGLAGEPNTVTDNGNGTITFRIDNGLTSLSGGSFNMAGRRALVYRVTPAREATTAAAALEVCTIQYISGQNRITTVGSLGQSVVSTEADEYSVILLGPLVGASGALEGSPGVVFIARLTGTGVGNVPSAGDTSLQNLIDQTLASLIAYDGGGNWADGTTNPATTINAQLDKIITDLTSTSGARGAGKLTAAARSAWLDGTANPAATAAEAIAKIVTDLIATAGSGGAARIGSGALTAWADTSFIGAMSIHSQLERIVDDLVAYAASGRIGAGAVSGSEFSLNDGTLLTQFQEVMAILDGLEVGRQDLVTDFNAYCTSDGPTLPSTATWTNVIAGSSARPRVSADWTVDSTNGSIASVINSAAVFFDLTPVLKREADILLVRVLVDPALDGPRMTATLRRTTLGVTTGIPSITTTDIQTGQDSATPGHALQWITLTPASPAAVDAGLPVGAVTPTWHVYVQKGADVANDRIYACQVIQQGTRIQNG